MFFSGDNINDWRGVLRGSIKGEYWGGALRGSISTFESAIIIVDLK